MLLVGGGVELVSCSKSRLSCRNGSSSNVLDMLKRVAKDNNRRKTFIGGKRLCVGACGGCGGSCIIVEHLSSGVLT